MTIVIPMFYVLIISYWLITRCIYKEGHSRENERAGHELLNENKQITEEMLLPVS